MGLAILTWLRMELDWFRVELHLGVVVWTRSLLPLAVTKFGGKLGQNVFPKTAP